MYVLVCKWLANFFPYSASTQPAIIEYVVEQKLGLRGKVLPVLNSEPTCVKFWTRGINSQPNTDVNISNLNMHTFTFSHRPIILYYIRRWIFWTWSAVWMLTSSWNSLRSLMRRSSSTSGMVMMHSLEKKNWKVLWRFYLQMMRLVLIDILRFISTRT